MKKFKKLLAVITALALAAVMLCASAMVFAESASQDGLIVSLTTDKDSYSQGESIVVTITVTNSNDVAVNNVSLRNVIPNGYDVADGSATIKSITTLQAGETVSFSVTLIPADSSEIVNVSDMFANQETVQIDEPVESGDTEEENDSDVDSADIISEAEETSNPETGNELHAVLIIFVLAIGCVVVCLAVRNKKHAQKLIALALCVTLTGSLITVMSVTAETDEVKNKTIRVSTSITVDGSELNINGIVSYELEATSGLPMPDDPTEIDEYYWSNSTVIEVISADESDNVMTEAEANSFLASRGFDQYEIACEYSMTGNYDSDSVAAVDSDTEHPMYTTYYYSANNELWTIYIIDGSVFAYPVSYIIEKEAEIPVLISESSETTSYDNDSNQFYITIPFESSVIVKTVDTINAETLDNLTVEEIDKL